MTNQQTYTSRSNAKRAARADLAKDAVEGRDYEITKHQDGRFGYQRVVSATKPDTGTKGGSGTRLLQPRRRGPCRTTTGAINTDCG